MKTVDIIVIGGGPAGYVAAIRAAQLGFSVLCVDKRGTLGGTCLNEGCIPSKALLHSSHLYAETCQHIGAHGIKVEGVSLDLETLMSRKDTVVSNLTKGITHLFQKNKIQSLVGRASLCSPQEIDVKMKKGTERWKATRGIILATGSEPIPFPGVVIDEKRVLSSTGALSLTSVPSEMIVLGGGYIGLEMGSVWQRLGSQVTILEKVDRLLPAMDRDVSTELQKSLEKQGMRFHLGQTVTDVCVQKKKVQVTVEGAGEARTLSTDTLLISLGRRAYVEGLNLEVVGITLDRVGRIPVNESFQTECAGIYAIGDVIEGPMLAHKASEEAVVVVERIAGQKSMASTAIPSVIYTHPQAASVGLTEEALKTQGVPYTVGKFPFRANSRAQAVGEVAGFVKILAHKETDRILGVHILGMDAETLIGEAVLGIEFQASAEDFARSCQAHPTYSEILKEAALAVDKRAIHI